MMKKFMSLVGMVDDSSLHQAKHGPSTVPYWLARVSRIDGQGLSR